MEFNINNFRSIKSASIELAEKITFVDGINGAGKSNLLKALRILLTGEIGTSKAGATAFVNRNSQTAKIEGNGLTVMYPKCTLSGNQELIISANASAIENSPLLLSNKEALGFYAKVLQANPTKKDLYLSLNFIEKEIRDKMIDKIWNEIENIGWDNSCKNAEKQAQGQRAIWGNITKENFGSQKAKNWRHPDWDSVLDSMAYEDITKAQLEAKEIYEDAIKCEAISDSKIEEIKKIVANEDNYIQEKLHDEIELEDLNKKALEFQQAINNLLNTRNSLVLNQGDFKQCPHCSEKISIGFKGNLEKFNGIDTKIIEENQAKAEKITEEITLIQQDLDSINNEIGVLNSNINQIKIVLNKDIPDYKKQLSELKNTKNNLDVADCLNKVKDWDYRLRAFEVTKEAEKAFNNYEYYKNLQQVLSTEGVRASATHKAVAKFNDVASQIFGHEKWKYRADFDFSVLKDDLVTYKDLSHAQQWCARVVYQVVCSYFLGDKIVLIDTIEAIDRDTVRELLAQLSKINGIKFVIARCSDSGGTEELKVEKLPKCKRYTIKDGEATECKK